MDAATYPTFLRDFFSSHTSSVRYHLLTIQRYFYKTFCYAFCAHLTFPLSRLKNVAETLLSSASQPWILRREMLYFLLTNPSVVVGVS